MKRNFAISLFFLIEGISIFADSPITSTEFWEAYSDYPIVNYAHKTGFLDFKIGAFLSDDENHLDVRAAVICSRLGR